MNVWKYIYIKFYEFRRYYLMKKLDLKKGVGVAGTVFSTGVSSYYIGDAIANDKPINTIDIVDAGVGVTGLTATGLTAAGVVSNPVGWGVGVGVALYSWCRFWFDIGAEYGPSKWYGEDDTKWFK